MNGLVPLAKEGNNEMNPLEKSAPDHNTTREKISRKKFNPWKIAFLTLLGLVLGIVLFLGYRIFDTKEDSYRESTMEVSQEPVLEATMTKEQVNRMIDFFLNEYLDDSGIKYQFYLENVAMLNGTFTLLGHDIQFYLYFDPYVLDNGNVQLKAKSLSIGSLDLPTSALFTWIQNNYKLPEWVEINASDEIVVLNLNNFELENGMFIRANEINLIDDRISFELYLPEK